VALSEVGLALGNPHYRAPLEGVFCSTVSDKKLRDLERRFRETGNAGDELAWLRERVRLGERLEWRNFLRLNKLDVDATAEYLRFRSELGELGVQEIELLASGGHLAAQKLVPHAARGSIDFSVSYLERPHPLARWWGEVSGLDRPMALAIALAAVRTLFPRGGSTEEEEKDLVMLSRCAASGAYLSRSQADSATRRAQVLSGSPYGATETDHAAWALAFGLKLAAEQPDASVSRLRFLTTACLDDCLATGTAPQAVDEAIRLAVLRHALRLE